MYQFIPRRLALKSLGIDTDISTVMGNKITYHSPSRGSSMELGASITILIFSQYKLPVSTSMCITGMIQIIFRLLSLWIAC